MYNTLIIIINCCICSTCRQQYFNLYLFITRVNINLTLQLKSTLLALCSLSLSWFFRNYFKTVPHWIRFATGAHPVSWHFSSLSLKISKKKSSFVVAIELTCLHRLSICDCECWPEQYAWGTIHLLQNGKVPTSSHRDVECY